MGLPWGLYYIGMHKGSPGYVGLYGVKGGMDKKIETTKSCRV